MSVARPTPSTPCTRPPSCPTCAMQAVLVLILCVAAVAAYPLDRSHAFTMCKTPTKKNDCLYGITKDLCKNYVCAKGPGDRCGPTSQDHGRCGEGMHCRCGVCTGCSVNTLDCHTSDSVCH